MWVCILPIPLQAPSSLSAKSGLGHCHEWGFPLLYYIVDKWEHATKLCSFHGVGRGSFSSPFRVFSAWLPCHPIDPPPSLHHARVSFLLCLHGAGAAVQNCIQLGTAAIAAALTHSVRHGNEPVGYHGVPRDCWEPKWIFPWAHPHVNMQKVKKTSTLRVGKSAGNRGA